MNENWDSCYGNLHIRSKNEKNQMYLFAIEFPNPLWKMQKYIKKKK